MSFRSVVRRPEFTGDNRCWPCTVVNSLLAVGAALAIGIGVAIVTGWVTPAVALGTVAFAVSIGAIYFRGYLVPGTPTLTRRYLPKRVHRWFEDPEPPRDGTAVDVEAILRSADAIEPCRDGADLCLTPEFRSEWETAIEDVDEESGIEELAAMIDLDPDRLTVYEYGEAFTISIDGEARKQIGQWESSAAFRADIAGARVLARSSSDWSRLRGPERGTVLGGLRLFLESCPACSGPVTLGEETVESCCSTHEVVALGCDRCGVRLFEEPLDPLRQTPDANPSRVAEAT
jgi:hypothetical protein